MHSKVNFTYIHIDEWIIVFEDIHFDVAFNYVICVLNYFTEEHRMYNH